MPRAINKSGSEAARARNASSTAVKRVLDASADADVSAQLHALYVTALLLGRVPPTDAHVALLRTAVTDLIETP